MKSIDIEELRPIQTVSVAKLLQSVQPSCGGSMPNLYLPVLQMEGDRMPVSATHLTEAPSPIGYTSTLEEGVSDEMVGHSAAP